MPKLLQQGLAKPVQIFFCLLAKAQHRARIHLPLTQGLKIGHAYTLLWQMCQGRQLCGLLRRGLVDYQQLTPQAKIAGHAGHLCGSFKRTHARFANNQQRIHMRHCSAPQMLNPGFHIHQHPFAPVQHQMGQQGLEQGVALTGTPAPGIGQRPHDQQALFALPVARRPSQRQGCREGFWQIAYVWVEIHHAALPGRPNALFNQGGTPGQRFWQCSAIETRCLP